MLDRSGTLKKAAQENDWPIALQVRTLEVSGVLQKQGIMKTRTDIGSQPEVGRKLRLGSRA